MKQTIEKKSLSFLKKVIDYKEKMNDDFYRSPVLCHQPQRPIKEN